MRFLFQHERVVGCNAIGVYLTITGYGRMIDPCLPFLIRFIYGSCYYFEVEVKKTKLKTDYSLIFRYFQASFF